MRRDRRPGKQAQGQARNADVGLTGVLIAFGGVFMQIVEGPTDALDGVFARTG